MRRWSALEQATQLRGERQVAVDNDRELLDAVLDVVLGTFDRHDDVAQLALGRATDIAHHPEPDERHRHGAVTRVASDGEAPTNDDVERLVQIVDDEDDIREVAVMPAALLGDDSLDRPVDAQGIRRLGMELVAGGTHDDAVDPPKPHPTAVDGGDERLGGDCRDVTIDDRDLHDSS